MEGGVLTLQFALELANRLDVVWTYLLLMVRFTSLLTILPGIGAGERGLLVRVPAIAVLAAVCLPMQHFTPVPSDWGVMILSVASEVCVGFLLGVVPLLIVAGVQMGAQISSTTMGLGVGNLIDPTLGVTTTDLSRILGDLAVIVFLVVGGHRAIILAASGLNEALPVGQFLITEDVVGAFVDHAARIFRLGLIISAPVMVALLLTNFVMALIARAVPTVNIFIVSFPLTIGIGLILVMLSLRDFVSVMEDLFLHSAPIL